MKQLGPNVDLKVLTEQVSELPPLPRALVELASILKDPDFSERRCVELIERDQALAARLLRLANSAFYGVPGRVKGIGDAMRILGARTVMGALTAAAVHAQMKVDACPGFEFEVYWEHSMASAIAARHMANLLDRDADEAFLVGLLHDIGQLVLAHFSPVAAARAIARARDTELSTLEAEIAELGFAHPQIGALVAEHWRFPAEICRAIEFHHAPEAASPGERVSLSGLVHLADKVAHTLNFGGDASAPGLTLQDWSLLNLPQEVMQELLSSTLKGVNEICTAINAQP